MRSANRLVAALLLAVTSGAASGQALQQGPVDPGRVIDVLGAEWTGDGGLDRAVLVEGREDADLLIYVSAGGPREMQLAAAARDMVWYGAMWGTIPSLSQSPAGGLQVVSQNESIGRNRWHQVLTIAYRGGTFVVAGFTYSDYDTLDPSATTDCDVNLLTGRGIKNGQGFRTSARALPVSEWHAEAVPNECFQ